MKRNIFAILAIIVIILGFSYVLKTKTSNPNNISSKTQQASKTAGSNATNLVTFIAKDLKVPWAIAFLPDKRILVTQRSGQVSVVDINGNKNPVPAVTIPVDTKTGGEGGLLGIAIHPNFNQNHFVYLYYTYLNTGSKTLNRVVRVKFDNNRLTNEQTIVDKIPGARYHNGGRIKFGPDGYLYITTGDSQDPSLAQDINSLAGKILRVTEEGKPVTGNPFNNLIYSYGHRNPQGIAWDNSGQLWETEHGPSGIWPSCCQDEINKIEKGGNYGWPESVGETIKSATKAPQLHSGRDIWAPSGTVIIGDSLYFAGLRGEALFEYKISEKKLIEHFKNQYGRLREVVLGPDNMLYITTSNKDGRGIPSENDDKIIRVNPAKL